MESYYADPSFRVHSGTATFDLFANGGSVFSMTTSGIFIVIYAIALMMPLCTCTKRVVTMPDKPSFYQYCAFLISLNMLSGLGSCLVFFSANPNGLCLINLSTFLYVSLLAPAVFLGFLNPFFGSNEPSILFSYKAQVNTSLMWYWKVTLFLYVGWRYGRWRRNAFAVHSCQRRAKWPNPWRDWERCATNCSE